MAEKWNLDGTYIEACNCEAVCPCIFTSPPTDGDCTAVDGWHIDSGSFGDVTLDGLNVVLMIYSPGHMLQTKWKVALYVDERATEAQTDALTQIYTGQAGGLFEVLGGFVGEVLGVKSVAIDIRREGRDGSLQIAGVADVEIEAIEGLDGAEVTVRDQPINLSPGHPLVVARSKHANFRDHGFQWEISGKSSLLADFSYQGGG